MELRFEIAMVMASFLPGAFACSCAPIASAPACQRISSADVAFLGTVDGIEPDPMTPGVERNRVYRFRVERVYKGIDSKTVEVVVNPDNLTDCQAEYRMGEQYIMFAGRWTDSGTLRAGECSGSRLAKFNAEDVSFLDKFAQGRSETSVSGRVLQWMDSFSRPDAERDAPVPGATVTLDDGTQKQNRVTGGGGEFRFQPIAPGRYTLSASAERYGTLPRPYQVEVASRGCVETFPVLPAHTRVSGILRMPDDAPASKKRVEVLRKNNSGQWYSTSQFWKNTDANGRFEFTDLPAGEYLLGYEIWHDTPSQYSPYPTQYFPSRSRRDQATVLHLSPQQSVADLTLKLGPPDTPRAIRVEVVWPDGSPPAEHLLQVFDGDDLMQNIGASFRGVVVKHNSVADLTGYEERTYSFHARYWVDDLGGPVPHDEQRIATSKVVQLDPGKGSAVVRLVL